VGAFEEEVGTIHEVATSKGKVRMSKGHGEWPRGGRGGDQAQSSEEPSRGPFARLRPVDATAVVR